MLEQRPPEEADRLHEQIPVAGADRARPRARQSAEVDQRGHAQPGTDAHDREDAC